MGISNNYWRDYWGNIGGTIGLLDYCIRIVEKIDNILHSSLGEIVGYLRN